MRKGIAVFPYDATCMLVEKVWKAARGYGREGYTVVIHGKHEHEETKATFSNTRRHAPAVIVRNLEETKRLGEIIAAGGPEAQARFHRIFAGKHTPGFDVDPPPAGGGGEPHHPAHERNPRDHRLPARGLCGKVRPRPGRRAGSGRRQRPQRHPLLRDAGEPGRARPGPGRAARRRLRHRRQEFLEHLPALPAVRAAARGPGLFHPERGGHPLAGDGRALRLSRQGARIARRPHRAPAALGRPMPPHGRCSSPAAPPAPTASSSR